ncbi:MAG: hypothetical protein HDT05_04490 [Bacteroidales bacterium]|nr:hypothetical protein [Bacteroidales bacterium]
MLMVRVRDVVITGICTVLVTQDAMTIGVMMTVSYIAGLIKNRFHSLRRLIYIRKKYLTRG